MLDVDLRKWLKKAGISQRELARRVGYSTNGPLSKIISGDAYVPPDAIPKWANALEISGNDRLVFIEECSVVAIPEWVLDELKKLRTEIATLRARNLVLESSVGQPSPPSLAERLEEENERLRLELEQLRKLKPTPRQLPKTKDR